MPFLLLAECPATVLLIGQWPIDIAAPDLSIGSVQVGSLA